MHRCSYFICKWRTTNVSDDADDDDDDDVVNLQPQDLYEHTTDRPKQLAQLIEFQQQTSNNLCLTTVQYTYIYTWTYTVIVQGTCEHVSRVCLYPVRSTL